MALSIKKKHLYGVAFFEGVFAYGDSAQSVCCGKSCLVSRAVVRNGRTRTVGVYTYGYVGHPGALASFIISLQWKIRGNGFPGGALQGG